MTLLDRYVQLGILRAFILVGLALVSLFSLFDFVEQLGSVGQGRYGAIDAFEYVLLTAPGRFMRLTPPSVLLASLLALGAMASSGELTALRALGVSKGRIIRWVLELGALIMVLLFLIAEFVAPPAQRLAEYERATKIAPTEAVRSGGSFWAHGDHGFVNVRHFSGTGRPEDVDIYVFRDDGSLESYRHAAQAEVLADGQWRITDVTSKQFGSDGVVTRRLDSATWASFLRPEQVQLLKLPPESMAPTQLFAYVRDLKRQHERGSRFEQQLWALLAIPFATAAMILTAAPFVFGSFRATSVGQRITVGAVVGIVFSLAQQIASYLGVLLSLDAALSALAPSLLVFSVLALAQLRERRHAL